MLGLGLSIPQVAVRGKGGSAPPSVAKLAAQRILASVDRGVTPITQVMASPPTFTDTGSATVQVGASAAFGGGQYQPTDQAAFRWLNCIWLANGSTNYIHHSLTGNVSTNGRRSGAGCGLATRTTAPAIEFVIQTAPARIAVYATIVATGVRQRISTNDLAGNATLFSRYYKIDFGSSADRIIEIYSGASGSGRGQAAFRGFNCTTGHTLVAPAADLIGARLVDVGDSHGDHIGSGNTNELKLASSDFFGERLGTGNPWCSSNAGTGFLNPASTSGIYSDRMDDGDLDVAFIGDRDLVWLRGTTNDNVALNAAYTDSACQTAVQATVAKAMLKQPNALIAVSGPLNKYRFSGSDLDTPQTRYDAIKAGVLAAAGGDARVFFVDNSPAGDPWITAGNLATMIGPDGTHLSNAGMSHVGYKMGDAVIAKCQALAA